MQTEIYLSTSTSNKLWTNQEGNLRVQRNISSRTFCHKPKFFAFWARRKNVPVSWRNIFRRLVETASHVSRETLWEKTFLFRKKTKFWLCLVILNEETPDFWRNFSTRVSRLKSTWPVELLKKFVEEDTIFYISMVFPRNIWFARNFQVRQEGILGVKWNFPWDSFLDETKLFKL